MLHDRRNCNDLITVIDKDSEIVNDPKITYTDNLNNTFIDMETSKFVADEFKQQLDVIRDLSTMFFPFNYYYNNNVKLIIRQYRFGGYQLSMIINDEVVDSYRFGKKIDDVQLYTKPILKYFTDNNRNQYIAIYGDDNIYRTKLSFREIAYNLSKHFDGRVSNNKHIAINVNELRDIIFNKRTEYGDLRLVNVQYFDDPNKLTKYHNLNKNERHVRFLKVTIKDKQNIEYVFKLSANQFNYVERLDCRDLGSPMISYGGECAAVISKVVGHNNDEDLNW